MKTLLLGYVCTFLPMLGMDAIWLSLMTKRFYGVQLAHLAAAKPNFVVGAVFYLLYVFGITALIVLPNAQSKATLVTVFFTGALLGLMAYGTYDLTNQATLRDWPVLVTIVDMIWGTMLTGTVSVIAVYLARIFLK